MPPQAREQTLRPTGGAVAKLIGRQETETQMLILSQVQTFLAIIDEGSIQSAAMRLSCSQPTVSQQLRKLEEFLGVPLIVRNRGHSAPTREGELFLPHARSLLATAERTRELIEGRRLVVAASGNVGVFLAPRLVAGFERQLGREGIVDLHISANRRAIDALLSGEADVIMTEWAEDHASVEWLRWRREKLVVIVAPNHPLAQRGCISKKELLEYPMMGGEPGTGTGRLLGSLFGKDVEKLRIERQLGSTAAVKEAVKANLGVSIVLACSVTEDMAFGSLVAIDIEEADIFKNLFLGVSGESPQTSLSRQFARFCSAAGTTSDA
jgi:DNA-binding transcriptional LysR family regulator